MNDNKMPISPIIDINLERIQMDLGRSDDVVIREIRDVNTLDAAAAIVYMDGLSDAKIINTYIFDVLNHALAHIPATPSSTEDSSIERIAKDLLTGIGPVYACTHFSDIYRFLLSGEAILLFRGSHHAYRACIREWKSRDVMESNNQTAIRGPRESFTETLRINTALIRRKIKDPNLWFETITIGDTTKTDITIVHVNGLAKPSVLENVRIKLASIEIDGVLDSGYIEELIEDAPHSLFPTVYNSDLPDVVAAQLLEGKVGILVDGTPNMLLVPTQLVTFFQSPEDYYQRAFYSSLLRILRFASVFISLLLPASYIAITTFHRDMLPTSLLIGLAAQREGVPFPAFVEALVMEVTFEILREAGLRMPKAIGQAVSVVGTLVIGQAAVDAGIVSAAMVIVVAVTAISTFTLPSYSLSIPIRILRFAFMGVGASFGLFGIVMGLLVLLLHVCSLRSFGEPYMSPFSPYKRTEFEDALFRLPRWLTYKRPDTSLSAGRARLRKRS
ncbi:spore germination protein [Paenibacillus whitsoniae]|nr:spore germination protein [Paenibacillus whitsoniae]